MMKDRVGMMRLSIWHALSLAFFLRVLFPVVGYLRSNDVSIFYEPDTVSYVVPAHQLATHLKFYSNTGPEIRRTPGYPILLTAGLLLGRLELVTIVVQILLSCFTVYMVYRMAQLLFDSEKAAILAAMLYAVEPLSIFYVSQLLTETLFTALLVVWFYFLLKYLKQPSLRYLIVSGLALAASIYVRPVGYFLPAVIAAGLMLWELSDDRLDWPRLTTHLAIFLAVSMGTTFLWQVRNRVEAGYPGFSSISSVNLYYYLSASVLAAELHMKLYQVQDQLGYKDDRIYFARHPEQRDWSPALRYEYMAREGERILLEHPLTYARIHLQGIVMVLFSSGVNPILTFLEANRSTGAGKLTDWGLGTEIAFVRANPMVFWSNALLEPLELLYLLSASMVLFSRQLWRRPSILAAVLTIAYYVVISGGPAGDSRFRVPIMPIICVLSTYGFSLWSNLVQGRLLGSASRNIPEELLPK
jgi:4-amino-4-deoxy-L-arabinose transferase-like glycosyltransferase